jgi:hypothetical protein
VMGVTNWRFPSNALARNRFKIVPACPLWVKSRHWIDAH